MGLRHSIRSAANLLLNGILPHRCALCDAPSMTDAGLCGACFPRLGFVGQPACPGCARPLHSTIAGQNITLCGTCLRDGKMFDHAVCALVYNNAAAELILRIKHGDRLDLVPLLSRWMGQAWQQSGPPSIDYIVPVPLFWKRQVARRYNQSLELGKHLGPLVPGTLRSDLVARTRSTQQMKDMNREARRINVRGAFAVPSEKARESLRGKHIVILDDVYTSGATLRAVAGTLRRAQVGKISVLVAARVTRADQ